MTIIPGGDSAELYAQQVSTTRARIARGETTPQAVLESQLARIAAREPHVHAFAWHDAEQVRRQLSGAPAGASDLPLAGIAIAVKDIIETADMPTQYGSAAYAGHQPDRDAVVVSQLKAAGAIIMGKTVTTEFAYQVAGPTVNPHNFNHSPGGSSSGSAAAVADGMVGLALGTQTGGSTIRPSAYCGIVGFKPTIGKISLEGIKPLASTMDTVGIHARSVADVKILANVLLGKSETAVDKKGSIRIAWYPGPHESLADQDALQALTRARDVLRDHGVELVEIDLPAQDILALDDSNRLIMAFEAGHYYEQLYRDKAALLGAGTVALIESGLKVSIAEFDAQRTHVARCKALFAHAMKGVDALLTFSAPGEAPLKKDGTGLSTFNRAWTTIGAPCLTLPFGKGDFGLPLGVQLVAAENHDHALLAMGSNIEQMLNSVSSK
ncbi:amidase [Zwartia sp.]|uniref:amidase n=1 Tax=Zwartia sp. TaxID=2978004 RepID=UPI00271ABAC4|nr:amidase [Zwartia sp.]MDO9026047.1 amidase [Zwartia sp.]